MSETFVRSNKDADDEFVALRVEETSGVNWKPAPIAVYAGGILSE